jgi:hypothetical protein
MIKFNIKADATFLAEDLDDAFLQLAQYFQSLVYAEENEESNLEPTGIISVKKVDPEE